MRLSKKCIRRVKGVRCTNDAHNSDGFCKDHIRDKCIVCENMAVFECRTCDEPLCATCQHHESFGH